MVGGQKKCQGWEVLVGLSLIDKKHEREITAVHTSSSSSLFTE